MLQNHNNNNVLLLSNQLLNIYTDQAIHTFIFEASTRGVAYQSTKLHFCPELLHDSYSTLIYIPQCFRTRMPAKPHFVPQNNTPLLLRVPYSLFVLVCSCLSLKLTSKVLKFITCNQSYNCLKMIGRFISFMYSMESYVWF